MKILLITVSARGHAIAEAIKKSRHNPEIIHVCNSRNPGIKKIADEQIVVDSLMDFDPILEIAKRTKPDFAIVAPDDPIGAGLVDALEEIGVKSMAPKKSLARIESSKSFTRDLVEKYGIDGNPKFKVFDKSSSEEEIRRYIEDDLDGEYVVKFDGLAGGKGVKVSGEHLMSAEEGVFFALKCLAGANQVVVEEKFVGSEFSLMSFVSGEQVVSMPAVQDHKRAYEGDTGPNTGGMGTYSSADHSLPFLKQEEIDKAHSINVQTAKALQEECGEPFKGILYGGFIVTKSGVKLIEYNARFGDPECLNVLPLLETDFVDICQAIINGDLNEDMVKFSSKATVCLYITPECYPNSKDLKGKTVEFPDIEDNARIFYGDLSEDDDGALRLGGSRTAGIVGIGDTTSEAQKIALDLCEQAKGPVRFRKDIGTESLIAKRIELMKELRSN
ncbi:phosphoribosylamine--glycine ligase [Candidatus Peribacteria bacterium]|nr:phosphoribosylamine--glycine ligase [Candidatus Peribacteria bacterium]MBT4021261.1 phosphoribosylamine--glycine ligase [Candidatus Peribacteria bacterium]MBT4240674.1 phosphoribosylamine--glycine ligase [Candidatus Peribacteria bacterium]MBT4474019.1 phosphoribosylamine--glycine ligase [Candidatus Peribacteria bacterium]